MKNKVMVSYLLTGFLASVLMVLALRSFKGNEIIAVIFCTPISSLLGYHFIHNDLNSKNK